MNTCTDILPLAASHAAPPSWIERAVSVWKARWRAWCEHELERDRVRSLQHLDPAVRRDIGVEELGDPLPRSLWLMVYERGLW